MVSAQEKASPRLRMNYNFHQSLEDKSHRMLNAVEPGTVVPIHRHPTKDECKKQVFDQQFSEKLVSADFGKQLLHILIDKAVMRQRAAASLLGA